MPIHITAPFFEIGPKNYLYGDRILELALAADAAAAKYGVTILFTTPYANIAEVAKNTKNLIVCAPFMDCAPVGRGLANVLPESLKAAGAKGVMLNHAERPLPLSTLYQTILRARELDMLSIVCADSMAETKAVAQLGPDIIVSEPTELIGTGQAADMSYVRSSIAAVRSISPDIKVLVGGGIANGDDVYNVIINGADATGSSSGIARAADPAAMIDEMICAVRRAWDARKQQ